MTSRHTHTCPIAATLNLIGDHWTMLIIREAFYGATTFSEIQRNTGIARNLLSARLAQLVGDGLLDRSGAPARPRYHLTDKGRSLRGVLIALTQWGNAQIYGQGHEPVELYDDQSGDPIAPLQFQRLSGQSVPPDRIRVRPGPGASPATRRRIESATQT